MDQDDPWAIIPATPDRSAPTRKRRRRGPLAVAGLAVLWVVIAVLLAGGTQLYRLGYDLLATPHPAAAHHQALPDAITTSPPPAPTPAATGAHRRHRHHHHSQLAAEIPVPIPPTAAPVPQITSTPPPRSPAPTSPTPSPPTPTTPEPTTPVPTPTPTFSSPSPEPSLTGSPSFRGR